MMNYMFSCIYLNDNNIWDLKCLSDLTKSVKCQDCPYMKNPYTHFVRKFELVKPIKQKKNDAILFCDTDSCEKNKK